MERWNSSKKSKGIHGRKKRQWVKHLLEEEPSKGRSDKRLDKGPGELTNQITKVQRELTHSMTGGQKELTYAMTREAGEFSYPKTRRLGYGHLITDLSRWQRGRVWKGSQQPWSTPLAGQNPWHFGGRKDRGSMASLGTSEYGVAL